MLGCIGGCNAHAGPAFPCGGKLALARSCLSLVPVYYPSARPTHASHAPRLACLFAMAISTRALWVQLTSQMWAGRLACHPAALGHLSGYRTAHRSRGHAQNASRPLCLSFLASRPPLACLLPLPLMARRSPICQPKGRRSRPPVPVVRGANPCEMLCSHLPRPARSRATPPAAPTPRGDCGAHAPLARPRALRGSRAPLQRCPA